MNTIVSAYCRISTKRTDQLNSLENQKNYFEEYVESKDGLELYNVYYDTLSATKWEKREHFKQMLFDAGLDIKMLEGQLEIRLSNREPKFSRILVKDVSRFARNILSVDIIRKLRDKKVYIDFTNMNLSTEKMSEDMMLGMFMLFAERESKDRSEKVLFGNKESAKNGVIRTADIFYGYKYIKESNSLEIVEHEAEIIRKVYDLYLSGEGFRKILQYLNDNNINARSGKPFVQTSINRMLSNNAYKGWLIRNKMDSPLVFTNKKSATLKKETEWVVHKKRIPAIVTEEVFDKAQEIRKSKVNYQNRAGFKNQNGEFAGLIFCYKCGSSFTRNGEKKTNRIFFNCKTKKTKGISFCSSPNINIEWLESALDTFTQDGINQTISDFKESYIRELEILIDELLNRIDNQQTEESSELKLMIEELELEKKRILKLYTKGTFTEDELNEEKKRIDDELANILKMLKDVSATNDDINNEINEINKVVNDINKFKIGVKYTRSDLLNMLSAIRIHETQGTINVKDRTEVKEKTIIFMFEFKVFSALSEIVQKYLDPKIIETFKSVSVLMR
jgi:site-specific DNA recombinase